MNNRTEQDWINLARKEAISRNLYESLNDRSDTFIWKKHRFLGFYTHFHSAIEICFMLKGSRLTTVAGKKILVEEGDICFVNPFEIHSFDYNYNDETYAAVLILSNNYLEDFYQIYGEALLPHHLADKEFNKQIYNLLADLPSSVASNQTLSPLAKKAYANLVLDKIANHYGVTKREQEAEIVTEIVSYISKNFNQKISLDTLAREFNYAKTSISRVLSKYLKTDLRCFVNNWRVEQAELLLNDKKHAHRSVTEIALMCGFESTATFYRAYKRRYDRLPKRK